MIHAIADIESSLFSEKKEVIPQIKNKCIEETCDGLIMNIKGIERCDICGIMVGTVIKHDPEWSNNPTKDMTRCGPPKNSMMPNSEFSGGISMSGWTGKYIYNNMFRIVTWHRMTYPERALEERHNNMRDKCIAKFIPLAIIEYALSIFFDIIKALESREDCKTKRGHNNEGLQAAALYQAFQDDGRPKTYKEIAEIFEIEQPYVTSGIILFRELMKEKKECSYDIKSCSYLDYVTKYSDSLKLPSSFRAEVIRVANVANSIKILDNNTPVAIIAGCIYYTLIISGTCITNKQCIERACDVSIPTISKVCDKLLSYFMAINA